jgi:hypothetical protein
MPLSDLELAQLDNPGVPDAQLVVQLAQRTLDELAMQPPIDHEIVASLRDVIRVEEAQIPWPGMIAHTEDGLVITLRANDSRGRKRFTVFHEVKHTFLPGFGTHANYRCTPTIAPPDEARSRDPDLEQLCDLGAAELLFPREPFRADLLGNAVTFDLVEELATHYDGSVEATARRVVTLHPRPVLFLVLAPCCKPTAPNARPQLRVQSVQAGGRWPFVPRFKSVPDAGVFGRARHGELIDEITSSLGDLTSDTITHVRVSARPYPYLDDQGEQHMRVLALITPAPSPRPRHAR